MGSINGTGTTHACHVRAGRHNKCPIRHSHGTVMGGNWAGWAHNSHSYKPRNVRQGMGRIMGGVVCRQQQKMGFPVPPPPSFPCLPILSLLQVPSSSPVPTQTVPAFPALSSCPSFLLLLLSWSLPNKNNVKARGTASNGQALGWQ